MTLCDLVYQIFPSAYDKGGGEVSVNCPFCEEEVGKTDTKFRLGINTDTGVAHCFRCEFKGGKKYVFRELCRVFNIQATLDVEPEDYVPEKKVKPKKKVASSLPEEYEPLWKNVNDKIGKSALRYVLRRNITHRQIKDHRIGFCATGRYAHRIIFPVRFGKKLRGFVCRDFTGKAEIKYLNSIGSKTLYNLPIKKSKQANLSEGIMDALSLERAIEDEDNLAALGSGIQIKKLLAYKAIVIWPDPDRPGVEGAIKKAMALQKKKLDVYIAIPTEEEIEGEVDLGKMTVDEVRRKAKKVVPYTSGVAKLMRTRIAFASPPKKARNQPRKQRTQEYV